MQRTGLLIIVLCLMFTGCVSTQRDTVFQVSTIDALLTGVYEGSLSCRSLLKQGDFGVGTLNDLDGEILVLDGKLYQVKSDGKVYEPELSTKTPFASVCRFKPDVGFSIDSLSSFERTQKLINEHASNQNLMDAIRITGQFRSMRTRSVPRQSKPYPPLIEVTSHQPEFQMENIAGTIIGFRFPAYIKGITIPGYHLHFISSDHTRGGHIMSFELMAGTCEIDVLHRFVLSLPEGDKAFADSDLSKDRSVELKKVEGAN